MTDKKFRPKPAAPSVRQTIGAAIARSRVLTGETPMSQRQVVQDVLAKLDLPAALTTQLRERHGLGRVDTYLSQRTRKAAGMKINWPAAKVEQRFAQF